MLFYFLNFRSISLIFFCSKFASVAFLFHLFYSFIYSFIFLHIHIIPLLLFLLVACSSFNNPDLFFRYFSSNFPTYCNTIFLFFRFPFSLIPIYKNTFPYMVDISSPLPKFLLRFLPSFRFLPSNTIPNVLQSIFYL